MRIQITSTLTSVCVATLLAISGAEAQQAPRHITLKSGESTELRNFYFVNQQCQSLMIGTPVLDVLEGPEELTVALKEGPKIPTKCKNRVPGGAVVATAKEVKARKEAKLTIRLTFKTRIGERQTSSSYLVTLFP
jgi:hypothetical protein